MGIPSRRKITELSHPSKRSLGGAPGHPDHIGTLGLNGYRTRERQRLLQSWFNDSRRQRLARGHSQFFELLSPSYNVPLTFAEFVDCTIVAFLCLPQSLTNVFQIGDKSYKLVVKLCPQSGNFLYIPGLILLSPKIGNRAKNKQKSTRTHEQYTLFPCLFP